MKDRKLTIEENRKIASGVYRLVLSGEGSGAGAVEGSILGSGDAEKLFSGLRPGQFVNLSLDGFFLRRPISVADVEDGRLTLIYKVVGQGTDALSKMVPGQTLNVLLELGNGYDTECAGERPLLIGGGVGTPPLYFLAKKLREEGRDVSVVLGFNKEEEIFLVEEFQALGCRVTVATADGSVGVKGFVTDALPENETYFYACGPLPMLKAVYRTLPGNGQFSLEERMGCGFGACMGCSIRTKNGTKRVCKDGPVFRKEELPWES